MNKEEIINNILEAIIPIAIISIILLICILILRILFYLILWIGSLFYIKNKKVNEVNKKPKKTEIVPYKKEEELLRDKKIEDKKIKEEFELKGVHKIGDGFEKQIEFNEDKIVGIAKPIGFWTSLVLGDQLSQILGRASALNDRTHKGFWVSMLEAQARGLGRKKSRILE
ncbi:MAG TPA: hypothetical protein VLL98_00610 [Rickettsiales bacterium]|nr:hypothetical protein [Rickettsiales bacterium]